MIVKFHFQERRLLFLLSSKSKLSDLEENLFFLHRPGQYQQSKQSYTSILAFFGSKSFVDVMYMNNFGLLKSCIVVDILFCIQSDG
jgi:hypothetical protein